MKVPTIHSNGTSRDELLRQVCDAGQAICDALNKMCDAAPNGRDYYPQGDGALKEATQEHRSRVARLESVLDEYMELAEQIADQ